MKEKMEKRAVAAKNQDKHALVDIKFWCMFGEFMFINKGGMKPFVKCDEWMHTRTDGQTWGIL